MSIVIDCKNKEILRLSNSLFGLLHETILELIEKNNLELTSQLNLLLTKTDQNIYGPCAVSADIDKYLKTKKEVLLLAELVKKTIELKYNNFNQFQGCIESLWNFHNELLNYANTIKNIYQQ